MQIFAYFLGLLQSKVVSNILENNAKSYLIHLLTFRIMDRNPIRALMFLSYLGFWHRDFKSVSFSSLSGTSDWYLLAFFSSEGFDEHLCL